MTDTEFLFLSGIIRTTPKREVIKQLTVDGEHIADIEETIGDGACFFRAVARAENPDISGYNESKRALELRELVCENLRDRFKEMEDGIIYKDVVYSGILNYYTEHMEKENDLIVLYTNQENEEEIKKHTLILKELELMMEQTPKEIITDYISRMSKNGEYTSDVERSILTGILGRKICIINTGDSSITMDNSSKLLPLFVEYNGSNHYSTVRFLNGKSIDNLAAGFSVKEIETTKAHIQPGYLRKSVDHQNATARAAAAACCHSLKPLDDTRHVLYAAFLAATATAAAPRADAAAAAAAVGCHHLQPLCPELNDIFFNAAKQKNLELFKQLIDGRFDLCHIKSRTGQSLLYHVAKYRANHWIHFVLERSKGLNIDKPEGQGKSPETVRKLINDRLKKSEDLRNEISELLKDFPIKSAARQAAAAAAALSDQKSTATHSDKDGSQSSKRERQTTPGHTQAQQREADQPSFAGAAARADAAPAAAGTEHNARSASAYSAAKCVRFRFN